MLCSDLNRTYRTYTVEKKSSPCLFQTLESPCCQVERRKAQLEHAKRAEAERLEEEAERRKRMLEYNLAEDIDPEQEDLCEAGAKPGRANVHTGLTPAPKSFAPEPRVIQSIEKATEEPQVPRELQGFGPDSTEDYMEARREQGLSRLQGQMGLAWHGLAWCCSSERCANGIYTGPISCTRTLQALDRPAEQRKRCVA